MQLGSVEAAAFSAFNTVFEGHDRLMLAVSGGSDSMALMWLVSRWLKQQRTPPDVQVVTVDHRLREASAGEARFVVDEAEQLGFEADILTWDGPRPQTGIAAAAREARYGLMTDLCLAKKSALVTAHTKDDQAETVVMALARGAGVDGLSAMQPQSRMNGTALLRPLLCVSRGQLRDLLNKIGLKWVDDPTNEDEKYERVRVRKALTTLREAGLETEAIARSAGRLARARTALNHAVDELEATIVSHEPLGFARLDVAQLASAPVEIALRGIMRVVKAYGGGMACSLSGAEDLLDWMLNADDAARTLAGCRIVRRKAEFIIGRELARVVETPRELKPGTCIACWDGRYRIKLAEAASAVTVQKMDDAAEKALPIRPKTVPDFIWKGLPVAISGDGKAELPGLGEQTCVFDPIFSCNRP